MEKNRSSKERLQILLQHLNLTDDQYVPYFKNGNPKIINRKNQEHGSLIFY